MNDRIKILMEQAGFDSASIERMGVMPNAEKFAQLIVEHCATVADFAHLGGVLEPGVVVREYFGVDNEKV